MGTTASLVASVFAFVVLSASCAAYTASYLTWDARVYEPSIRKATSVYMNYSQLPKYTRAYQVLDVQKWAYTSDVLRSTLVLWAHWDETNSSSNYVDSSKYRRTINNPRYNVRRAQGFWNQSVTINATNWLNVTEFNNGNIYDIDREIFPGRYNNQWEIECWINTTYTPTAGQNASIISDYRQVLSIPPSYQGWALMETPGGALQLMIGCGASCRKGFFTTSTINDGKPHLIGLSMPNDGSYTLYYDGASVKSGSFLPVMASDSRRLFQIGRFFTSTSFKWRGQVDDCMVFSRILSTNERKALNNSIQTPIAFNYTITGNAFYNVTGYSVNRSNHVGVTASRRYYLEQLTSCAPGYVWGNTTFVRGLNCYWDYCDNCSYSGVTEGRCNRTFIICGYHAGGGGGEGGEGEGGGEDPPPGRGAGMCDGYIDLYGFTDFFTTSIWTYDACLPRQYPAYRERCQSDPYA